MFFAVILLIASFLTVPDVEAGYYPSDEDYSESVDEERYDRNKGNQVDNTDRNTNEDYEKVTVKKVSFSTNTKDDSSDKTDDQDYKEGDSYGYGKRKGGRQYSSRKRDSRRGFDAGLNYDAVDDGHESRKKSAADRGRKYVDFEAETAYRKIHNIRGPGFKASVYTSKQPYAPTRIGLRSPSYSSNSDY